MQDLNYSGFFYCYFYKVKGSEHFLWQLLEEEEAY